ncbi:MAG: RnfABCDGE type electron transport complex subunit G [Prolixibacteraceae bacterium]|jgi:electron transport complex protein RnfG|nr:RnfABCDGE type electron transport complex subunit G [Prolixibacteraceae bacterium]
MAKLESSFKNMVIALFGVTLIASAALGLVNDATIEPIAKAEMEKQTNAIAAVLTEFDSLGIAYKFLPSEGKDSIQIFPALNAEGEIISNAIKSYTYKGFSGYIEVMVGISNDGIISGYQVLKHAETPGLGSKMGLWFSNAEKPNQNVIGKSMSAGSLSVSKDGGSIDAITAATISSRAFLDAVNRAYSTINESGISTQKE